jgi:hypothetical protein
VGMVLVREENSGSFERRGRKGFAEGAERKPMFVEFSASSA